MNEHLPECPVEKRLRAGRTVGSQTCICDALRACEQRVRDDERSNNFTPDDHADGMTEAYSCGLDAAREAVAEFTPVVMHDPLCEWTTPCIYGEGMRHSRDGENPPVPDATYCWMCGADCSCELIEKVRRHERAAIIQAIGPTPWRSKENNDD